MKTTSRVLISLLVFASPAVAQDPVSAARATILSASAGYTYVNLEMPSSPRANLYGLDTSFTADFLPRLGGTADLSYARSSTDPATGHSASVLGYLFGPVFYPVKNRKLQIYARGLFGGARVAGPIFFDTGGVGFGWVNKPAVGVGTGIEFRVYGRVHMQVGADYVHTYFYNPSLTVQGQNNLRTVLNVVYDLGLAHRRR